MKSRTASVFTWIIVLLLISPIIFWVISESAEIYPESSSIHFKKPMVSRFWEQRGVHKRECVRIHWSFVAIAEYTPSELLQYYENRWRREPRPSSPLLSNSDYQGRFFAIFSFIASRFEISQEKYVGYNTKNISPLEYEIGNYLFFCKLDDWYE